MNPVIEHLPKSQKKEQRPGVLTKPLPPYLSPAIPSSDRKPNTQLSSCSPFGEEKSHRECRKRVEENKVTHTTSQQSDIRAELPTPRLGKARSIVNYANIQKKRKREGRRKESGEERREEGREGGREERERKQEK